MKRVLFAVALLGTLVGCKPEAERFGYKGVDLADAEREFFSTGPGVTNWVPARVLNVYEKYDFSADELKLVSATGIVTPSETLEAIPEGYVASATEPWFTTYEKASESFSFSGKCMFIAHREDDGKWQTAESSFSSYWPDKAAALAALATVRTELLEKFGAKKIYDFTDSFAAEYVRLRVLGLVGQKADGTWSCMLSIQDKCRPGCGNWFPVEEQQEHLNRANYRKAMIEWQAQFKTALNANHEIVEKRRQELGIEGFGAKAAWLLTESGRLACVESGFSNATNSEDASSVKDRSWSSLLARAKAVSGVDLTTVEPKTSTEHGVDNRADAILEVSGKSELYEVFVGMSLPREALAETNEEGQGVGQSPLAVQWQIVCFENLQPGVELPVRPTPPQ